MSDQCSFLARTAAQLDTHRIRKHTSSQMFSCQFCDYKSKRKEHVETHKAKYCRNKRLREQNIEPLTCKEVVDMWSSTNSDFNDILDKLSFKFELK